LQPFFSQPIKGKGFLLSGSPLLKLIIYLSRCIKAVLQKDPSGLCAFCWRDGSVGHLVAGIPGINIAGVGENPRRRGGFRTAGKRKKTILFGSQNASPEGSPLQKMWTKEGTLKQ
ncbi:mCG1026367, isoform CRA_b, partial [Mus musculus]